MAVCRAGSVVCGTLCGRRSAGLGRGLLPALQAADSHHQVTRWGWLRDETGRESAWTVALAELPSPRPSMVHDEQRLPIHSLLLLPGRWWSGWRSAGSAFPSVTHTSMSASGPVSGSTAAPSRRFQVRCPACAGAGAPLLMCRAADSPGSPVHSDQSPPFSIPACSIQSALSSIPAEGGAAHSARRSLRGGDKGDLVAASI